MSTSCARSSVSPTPPLFPLSPVPEPPPSPDAAFLWAVPLFIIVLVAMASLGLPLTNTEGRIGNPTIMLLATVIMVGNIGDVTKQPTVTKLDTYVRAIELLAELGQDRTDRLWC